MASSSRNDDAIVAGFLSEVKAVEKRDAVLTKEQQIERLTKPGSKYGNLNPFAVLMVGYDADENTTRKSFRKLSILTHPDKNPDQKELAQRAFDAVKAAYETLSDHQIGRATSELQSRSDLVCRLLLEKKKKTKQTQQATITHTLI